MKALNAQALLASEDPEIRRLVADFKKALYPELLRELKEQLERDGVKGMKVKELSRLLGQVERDTRQPANSINLIQVPITNGIPSESDVRRHEQMEALSVEQRRELRRTAHDLSARLEHG